MKRTVGPVAKESEEQANLILWWRYFAARNKLPEFALYSVPNGAVLAGDARRRAMQMHKLKRTGLRPGMPDLNLDIPIKMTGAGGYLIPGLRIEMKRTGKGSVLSKEQEEVIMFMRRVGYHVVVARGFDEARQAIEGYLKGYLP